MCNEQTNWGLGNTSPFENLQSGGYWADTALLLDAWGFSTYYGLQGLADPTINEFYAWAVHRGDVAFVPEPGSVLLLGLALAGLAATRRRGTLVAS